VDDIVGGFVRRIATDPGFTGRMNLVKPGDFTIVELAERMFILLGSNLKLVFISLPLVDPKQRQLHITLAKAKLDWTPKGHLEKSPYAERQAQINLRRCMSLI
jgi:UDP-glucuronate decarboxylase